jgi:TPR repeat protein
MNQTTWNALLKKARKGDVGAQLDVGVYYEEGFVNSKGKRIVVKDPAKAVQWYRLAAEQGNSAAQNQLGVCLSTGKGTRRDLKQAISWTSKALAQADPTAAHNLATIYRDMGQFKKAFELYRQAVTMGELDSLLEVGLSLYYGIGTKKNLQASLKCFNQIIKTKPSSVTEYCREEAFYMLGIASLNGHGTKQSLSKARSFFESANKDEDHQAAQLLLTVIGRNNCKR